MKAGPRQFVSMSDAQQNDFWAGRKVALTVRRFRRSILRWYSTKPRHFFWREPGVSLYHLLVVEILLSRTIASAVDETAQMFLRNYPTPAHLARADARAVEKLLFPLGLQKKRARLLIRCAKSLTLEHGGMVPATSEELLALPYVGRYAANALLCFGLEQRRPVIDANVSRIYQRVFSFPSPPKKLSIAHDLWAFAERLLPRQRVREFNWGLLDLGGTICLPKSPLCNQCPVASLCDWRKRHGSKVVEVQGSTGRPS